VAEVPELLVASAAGSENTASASTSTPATMDFTRFINLPPCMYVFERSF